MPVRGEVTGQGIARVRLRWLLRLYIVVSDDSKTPQRISELSHAGQVFCNLSAMLDSAHIDSFSVCISGVVYRTTAKFEHQLEQGMMSCC